MISSVIIFGVLPTKDFPFGSVNGCKQVFRCPGSGGGQHLIVPSFFRNVCRV